MKHRIIATALGCALSLAGYAQAPTPRTDIVDFGPARLGAVVTTATTPEDEALKQTLTATLSSDQALDGAQLSIAVNGGQVLVAGIARDEAQAMHARDVAAAIAGAEQVSASITTMR